jgi:hypothetical protein
VIASTIFESEYKGEFSALLSSLALNKPEMEAHGLSSKAILDTLSAWVGSTFQPSTFNYRVRGTDTLTWGNQGCWIEIKGIYELLSLPRQYPTKDIFGTYVLKYIDLMEATGSLCSHRRSSFLDDYYMHQVETWANAYDQEALKVSPQELEALYDESFFEAVELANELP